jgi:pimeloyl-ACP methyl ester carboxylesterase
MAERRIIDLPGGRAADVLLGGLEDGLPLVIHNGTPGGLVAWSGTLETARARGMRVIMVARPGYEDSTPRPGRRVADIADDVAAVLDALGCDTFVTVGWSGGGPHALACSAMLGERCLAAATLAGVAPYPAAGLDWMAGMGPENVAEFGAALQGEAKLTAFLEQEATVLGQVTGADVVEGMGGLLSEADKSVLTGEFADYLAAALRAALSHGIAGWRDDDLAFTSDWGFALTTVGKAAIWQGSEDFMVPQAHGKWLAKHIPHARHRMRRGEGHLTLMVTSFGEVLDDLIQLAKL